MTQVVVSSLGLGSMGSDNDNDSNIPQIYVLMIFLCEENLLKVSKDNDDAQRYRVRILLMFCYVFDIFDKCDK